MIIFCSKFVVINQDEVLDMSFNNKDSLRINPISVIRKNVFFLQTNPVFEFVHIKSYINFDFRNSNTHFRQFIAFLRIKRLRGKAVVSIFFSKSSQKKMCFIIVIENFLVINVFNKKGLKSPFNLKKMYKNFKYKINLHQISDYFPKIVLML